MKVEDVKRIACLGTGTMGYGITFLHALHGYHVRMFGRSEASVERGMKQIRRAVRLYIRKGLLEADKADGLMARIAGVTTLKEAVTGADFVMEAVAEDLDVKHAILSEVEDCVKEDCVIASTTSGLSPTALAECLKRPRNFIVAHYWNPPHLVPLVEIVPGKKTAKETIDFTWAITEKVGKKPVALKREALGFIGNRLQLALLREALYIVEEGIAAPEAVDRAIKYGIGRRLGVTGPLESADLGGLDIFCGVAGYLNQDLCNGKEPSRLLEGLVAEGKLGAKTGAGFYEWSPERLEAVQERRESILIDFLNKDKEITF